MKKLILFTFAALALLSCTKTQKYDVAAYIWPAFHNDPRWAEIGLFPEGKGEWESIYKAQPKFEGHRQPRVPLWGYMDEASPESQKKIISEALKYGVNTFIFDWYWYDNRAFLEAPLNAFLQAPNNKKMKFYLMWANHTANSYWDRDAEDKSQVYWKGETPREVFDGFCPHLIKDYFSKPNYYRIGGKPVFAIYEVGTFINGMGGIEQAGAALKHLDSLCVEAGLGGVHLQAILWGAIPTMQTGDPRDSTATQDNTVKKLGFESLTNYQWCHFVPLKEYEQWGDEAVSKYAGFDKDFSVPYFPHVSIDWDNNPRYPGPARPAVSGVTPAKFRKFLQKAKDYVDAHPDQAPLVTINAWNEWSEGSYLEPDTEFGYGFLEAVRDVFCK